MAGRAVDVVPLLPARENVAGDGERESVGELVADFTCVEFGVGIEMAASDGVVGERPRRAMVVEEVGGPQGDVLGLILHILAAGGGAEEQGKNGDDAELSVQLQTPH